MASLPVLVLSSLALAADRTADSPIFPAWGRTSGEWKMTAPGPGWTDISRKDTSSEAGADFRDGFRAVEMKYFRPMPSSRSEITEAGFTLSAAPGQYASISIRIEAKGEWRGLGMALSPLEGRRGTRLGADLCDIRMVRPLVKRIYQTKTYARIPTLLDKVETLDLDRGRPANLWITLHVPPGQPPGRYKGKLSLTSGSGTAWSAPITLKVLPIRLEEPPRTYQLYYSLSGADPVAPGTAGLEMRDIRSHGINSLAFLATPELADRGGAPTVDFSRSIAGEALGLDSLIACYKAAGFTLPINYSFCLNQLWHHPEGGWRKASKSGREFRRALKTLFSGVSGRVRSGEWPILHFGLDEPSPRLDEAVKFLEWVREDYPYPSLVNCHGAVHGVDDVSRLAPLAGIVSVTRTVPGFAKAAEQVRAHGRKFWICNGGGFGADPLRDRYFFGLDAWKLGADGVSQWNYHQGNDEFWTPEKPYGKERGDYPTFAFGYPSATGPIPSMAWEAVREGIDDAKYLATLEALLARGALGPASRGKKGAALERGRKYLDSLKASLPVENGERLRYLAGKEEDFLDCIRERIAGIIISAR